MNNNIKREEIMGVKEGEIMGSNFSRDDKDRILKWEFNLFDFSYSHFIDFSNINLSFWVYYELVL